MNLLLQSIPVRIRRMLSLSVAASAIFASLVLVTGSVTGCAGTTTQPSTGEYIDDSVVTTRVKAALLRDNVTPGTAIQVETFRGAVQLSGFVDTEAQRTRAADLARGVAGVQSVVNNIVVKTANQP